MSRRLSVIAALVGALGLVVAFALWRVPADEFILAPDRAKPLAGKVEVEDARPAGDTSVYYVDVFVRRTSLLEQLLPFTKPDGSTVLPERALLPPGTSEAERDRQNTADMERSEKVAAVVALRAVEELREVLRIDAQHVAAHAALADLYARLGDGGRAAMHRTWAARLRAGR